MLSLTCEPKERTQGTTMVSSPLGKFSVSSSKSNIATIRIIRLVTEIYHCRTNEPWNGNFFNSNFLLHKRSEDSSTLLL